MNILYVVSRPLEINTSASIRNRATIEGLLALGHNVDIITSEPDKNHSNYDDSILKKNINITYLKLGGVQNLAKFGRKFKFLKPIKNMLYNIMSKFDIYDNLKDIANHVSKINIKDGIYEIVISSSDPKSSHLFVRRMFESGLLKDTPWIQIWGDPFFSDISRKNKFLDSKIKNEENRLLEYATKVIYVSKLTLREQQNLYPKSAFKMFFEPIPYVKEEIYPLVDLNKDSLSFLYCGDYSSNIRSINALYEAVKNTNHQLVICGNSDIKLENTERIKIFPRVSFEKTKELERKCDILVHLSNLKGTQIPGKIYQYSGNNKPILFLLDGDKELLKENFEKYNRYIFCHNDFNSIGETIEEMYFFNSKVSLKPVRDFSPMSVAERVLDYERK